MSTSTSDHQLTEHGPAALPPAVFDLLSRIKELEHADGSWPGGDTVSVLCEWFTDLGVDPAAALSRYTRTEPDHCSGQPTVYLVQRDTFDGLYLFADPDQAAEYAALFDGADTGTQTVINGSAGAQLIIDSQPCPDCGDREDCGFCPVGDPGCDAMGCQSHDHCLTPIPAGTRVHLADEDPTDLAGPEVLIGTVVDPTDQERADGPEEPPEVETLPGCDPTPELTAMVMVAWPWHRRWELREDLTPLQES